MRERWNTHQKALALNLDSDRYGTVAEIGAGQEVARWFFQVGGAAGTIAKSMSAYDMAVSDAIYGSSTRYVSRERVLRMLEYEYGLLKQRLSETRGETAQFFVFANTVTARSYSRRDAETHGWMGLRFQHEPGGAPSDIVLHVRLLDAENVQQQEAIGILGVNLIHAGFEFHGDPGALISSLMDGLSLERIEVNMISCSGPAFPDVDHRLLALELIARRLTGATMFRSNGDVVDAGELLYRKPVLIVRGSFRPVTNTVAELIRCARNRFLAETNVEADELVLMAEMTLNSLSVGETVHYQDFLDRVDILASLGLNVLITNTHRNFRLAGYLFQHTKQRSAAVIGLTTLREMFRDEYYSDLEGGILEAFGRLFKNGLKIYAYPLRDSETGALDTVESMEVPQNLKHLHAYLIENRFIEGLDVTDESLLSIFASDVLAMIQSGTAGWEELVPDRVATLIKERKLLRYQDHS